MVCINCNESMDDNLSYFEKRLTRELEDIEARIKELEEERRALSGQLAKSASRARRSQIYNPQEQRQSCAGRERSVAGFTRHHEAAFHTRIVSPSSPNQL